MTGYVTSTSSPNLFGVALSRIRVENMATIVKHLLRSPTGKAVLWSRCVSVSVSRRVFDVKDAKDFQERVMKASTPVIVDFHADWCGPCKTLGPLLEAAVVTREGKVELAKVDIDQLPDLAMDYNVTAVPSVFAVKDGAIRGQFVGSQNSDFIEEFIKKVENC